MAWQWTVPKSITEVRYSPHTGRRLSPLGRAWWFIRLGGLR